VTNGFNASITGAKLNNQANFPKIERPATLHFPDYRGRNL